MASCGAHDVAKIDKIYQVQEYLYNKVCQARCSADSSIYDIHNIETIYTALMFMWSVLHRGTSNPLPYISNFSEFYWTVMISDKDYKDEFNSRIVYVPLICRAQIKSYIAKTSLFINKVEDNNIVLYKQLKYWSDSKIVEKSRVSRRADENAFVFFLVSENTGVTVLTPKIIMSYIEEIWPLNIHNIRKSIGSLLSKEGCPDIIINKLLGHYTIGNEPSGAYSTFNPRVFKRSIATYLDDIAKRIGWKVL